MTDHFTTPYDDDPLMLPAFLGCVRWALGEDQIVARYKMETGDTLFGIPGAGQPEHFIQRFSDWIAANVFGLPGDVYADPACDRETQH